MERRIFGKNVEGLDSVWRTLKPWGRFQCFQLFFILLDNIPAAFSIFTGVFTGKLMFCLENIECVTI